MPKNNSLPSIGFHHCDKNKPQFKDLAQYSKKISSSWERIAVHLDISRYEVDVIERNNPNDVEGKCFDMFTIWLRSGKSPCWCHFVQALGMVGLNEVAEEAETHLRNSYSYSTSSTMSVTPQPEVNGDQLTLDQKKFVDYLKDIRGDWMLFVTKLLSHRNAMNVIREIRRSGGSKTDNMSRIYTAFSNERDPSWTKVHRALKEANHDDLAETIETCFLPI